MPRLILSFFILSWLVPIASSQTARDPVSQALSQGDLYFSKHKYDLAIESYRKADKLSHHTSAAAYLHLASTERKLGAFSLALDDAKRAEKVGGNDKTTVVEAHQVRAALLAQMSGKPTDKKLKEAEDELRQSLTLDVAQPLTHYNLGIVLIKQERDSEGVAELNTFVSSPGADSKTVSDARRIIANPIRGREPFAPDFSFSTSDNRTISNASLHGTVVLLDFWATWCPPCRESLPIVRGIDKKYVGKQFQVVSVSGDDDEDVWRTFTTAQNMTWSQYIDLSNAVEDSFTVDSIPTFIVLDKDGVIRYRQSGLSDSTQGDIEDAINKALKHPSDPTLAAAAAKAAPESSPSSPVAIANSAANTSSDEKSSVDDAPAEQGSSIDIGTISGNIYKNEDLQITYTFPQGWTAEKPDLIRDLNVRKAAAMRAALLQQHPEMASSLHISFPKFILYASRTGQGEPDRMSVPSLRISAARTQSDDISVDLFDEIAKNMAVAQKMTQLGPASKLTVKDHDFVRADFERPAGSSKVYYSYVQTISGDYKLTIEMFASSKEDLQKIADSLQSMVITDE
jgi:thiol-disulfide isomerase/thioredoxin